MTVIQCPLFFIFLTVLLGRVPDWRGFTVEDHWAICKARCLIEIACASLLPNIHKITSQLFGVLITSIKPPLHLLEHILNSRHISSTIPRKNFLILRWKRGPTPIVSVTIVTPVEVVVTVVVAILNIVTLSVVIPIVPP